MPSIRSYGCTPLQDEEQDLPFMSIEGSTLLAVDMVIQNTHTPGVRLANLRHLMNEIETFSAKPFLHACVPRLSTTHNAATTSPHLIVPPSFSIIVIMFITAQALTAVTGLDVIRLFSFAHRFLYSVRPALLDAPGILFRRSSTGMSAGVLIPRRSPVSPT